MMFSPNVQYGLRLSHRIPRFWQAKQSSAAPLAAVRRRRFRAVVACVVAAVVFSTGCTA